MKIQKEYETAWEKSDLSGENLTVWSRTVAIVKDHSVPCGYCGINCSGEFYIWFEENQKQMTILIDSGTFSSFLCGHTETEKHKILNYDELPEMVKEFNEDRSWAAFESDRGEVLDIQKLDDCLKYLETKGSSYQEFIDSVREFRDHCVGNNYNLMISYF